MADGAWCMVHGAGLPNLFRSLPFSSELFDIDNGGRSFLKKRCILILFGRDAQVLGLWANLESAVYKELKKQ